MNNKKIQCPHCKKPLAFADLFAKSFEKKVCAQYCERIKEKDDRIAQLEKELGEHKKLACAPSSAVVCCPDPMKKEQPRKMNCWEFKKCGREPGGAKVKELGVCPAAVCDNTEGVNCGTKGGRACWAIAGTFCGGKTQGAFAQKLSTCVSCEFYKKVVEEEGERYQGSKDILEKLHPDEYAI